MARHPIYDDGEDTGLIWSDRDGDWDPDDHQTVYRETPCGTKEVKDLHYSPKTGKFHNR